MKKEKIYALLKKGRTVYLFNRENPYEKGKVAMQYITDGVALYPLENLPVFDAENIWGLLGAEPDAHGECRVCEAPDWLLDSIEFPSDNDIPLERYPYDAFGYAALHTHHMPLGDDLEEICAFINPKYLAPIDEEHDLWYRVVNGNGVVIVVAGMFVKAVIVPYRFGKVNAEARIEFLEMLLHQQRNALSDEEQMTLW